MQQQVPSPHKLAALACTECGGAWANRWNELSSHQPHQFSLIVLHGHCETLASAKENRLILDNVLSRGYRVSESLFAFLVLTKHPLGDEIRVRGRKEVDCR